MARRGRRRGRRGDGSIVRIGGRFQARWSTTEGGIRKRKAKTFDLRTDAEWWLGQATRHDATPDDITVAEHLERWLAGRRNVAASTRLQYENHVRVHLIPVLGGHKLVALRQRHVEAFVEDRQRYTYERTEGGRRYHLSPATIGKLLVTLRSALETAVPRDIPYNPAARVEAPKVERRPVRAMTPDEAVAILNAVEGTWLEYIVRVLLGSGMRIGEAVALNQGDVEDGWVRLRRSKTTIRAVRLSDDANEAIHAAIRSAPRRGRDEPVFFSLRRVKGTTARDRMRVDSVSPNLAKHLERAGLTPMRAHALRHGTATLMVAAGVHMRLVAEQLGHADPAMTARVYSHVSPESQRAAMTVLDEAVRRR